MPRLSRITFYEREKIELYLKMGKNRRWIGRRLRRSHTDILREINRPEEINRKERIGDWETDSLIFAKAEKNCFSSV